MEIVGQSKFIRTSPRKLGLVARAVCKLPLTTAMAALENLDKRAAKPILLTFKQTIANAVNNFGLDKESLEIKEIQVGKGPTLKRWRAVSRGRARSINKRTSHLKIILIGKKKEVLKKPESKQKFSLERPKTRGQSLLAKVTGRRNEKLSEKKQTKETRYGSKD